MWAGVTGIFRDYGYRRSRMHARLKFLMADWGPQAFREKLESDEYLGYALPDGPEAPPVDDRDHVGVHAQSDGNVYIGTVARVLSLSLRLFMNIFGEHTTTGVFASLVPIVVPWPMMALGIFTAFLQAYVFALLTAVYVGGAVAHEEH